MYADKIIKLNKKVKLKSLKQVIDLCLKNGVDFNLEGNSFLIQDGEGYEDFEVSLKEFGKEFTINTVVLQFDSTDGEIISEEYTVKQNAGDIPACFSFLFSNFPKLTKAQRAPLPLPPPPPEPEVTKSLLAGKGHSNYDMKYLDDGTMKVGCNEFSDKQLKNVFKFLADCLDYDLEK